MIRETSTQAEVLRVAEMAFDIFNHAKQFFDISKNGAQYLVEE